MVCPAGVDRACWVSWCTPAGKKTSIDSLSYGNGHSELYPGRYNYNWILNAEACNGNDGSGIAFSQGVEEGSLGANVTTCLLNINCYSILFGMLQDAWSCLKKLVFDRLGFPLLFWHSAVQSIDTTPFH